MKDPIIWSISFNQNRPHLQFHSKAAPTFSPQMQRQIQEALGLLAFLDQLNQSFKEAADKFFDNEAASDEMRHQAQAIREQFLLVQEWINEMRKHFPQ